MSTDTHLVQLFRTCDKKGKGFIVQEELRELCSGLGITDDDSDVIFSDLDQDKDGKISYQEFSKGFKEFINPEPEALNRKRFSFSAQDEKNEDAGEDEVENNVMGDEEIKRRESVYQAWNSLTAHLAELKKAPLNSESNAQIRGLLQELETSPAPTEVASKVGNVVSTLLEEINHLHSHQQRERAQHVSTLQSLETEMEQQVARVEQAARQQARQESQDEKRALQDQMEQEMAELHAHLKIFQKVDSWLRHEGGDENDRVQEVRKKLEEAYATNRSMNMTLNETTTNLGLLRSDLAHLRLQYEDKCRELHNEREQVLEYMHQYDHMKRQLELLHEANKRLQDTNDTMRNAMEIERWRTSPLESRGSSARSSLRRSKERKRSHRSFSISSYESSRSRSPLPSGFPSLESEGSSIKYGIRRLMDDLDSGLSTLPDAGEDQQGSPLEDHKFSDGPLSLEEELLDLESQSSPQFQRPNADDNSKNNNSCISDNSNNINNNSISNNSSPGQQQLPLRTTDSSIASRIPNCPTPPPKPRRASHEGRSWNECHGPPERTYKVVFAGDAAVGKSTFIMRLCSGSFISNIASTLGVDYKVKTLNVDEKNIAIQLWDTAGQERFRSITKTYFRRADGVLLLYDVTSERSFLNVRQWIQSIDDACESRVPLVLCGNKMDLRDKAESEGRSVVNSAAGENLARECGADFIETSCKSGTGVMNSFVQLARQMVTTEDLEVQTSALRVCESQQSRTCCGGKKEKR